MIRVEGEMFVQKLHGTNFLAMATGGDERSNFTFVTDDEMSRAAECYNACRTVKNPAYLDMFLLNVGGLMYALQEGDASKIDAHKKAVEAIAQELYSERPRPIQDFLNQFGVSQQEHGGT